MNIDQTDGLDSEIRKAVRDRYATLAQQSTCCKGPSSVVMLGAPAEAEAINAGCGSPLTLITPRSGQVIVDLGSGGGIDVFRASSLVGDNGKAVGVDATPEMIWRARDTARKYGYANVEFRLGEIETLPIESESVDYVISNCVINLSPNKQKVFNEAYRVLKRGGIFAVADITSGEAVPNEIRENLEGWSSCISGAITRSQYEEQLKQAGFKEVEIKATLDLSSTDSSKNDCCCTAQTDNINRRFKIQGTHIIARKE